MFFIQFPVRPLHSFNFFFHFSSERSHSLLASVPSTWVEMYTAPWVQCTQEFASLICSMRAARTPPFICVSAKQLWHRQGISSEAKNKVIAGTTSVWRGTRGLLASQTCMCAYACVCDEYLLWPLSSNVLTLNLPDSGTFGRPCPSTHSNTIPALLQDCIFKFWTRRRNQDINQLVASTYTRNLKRVRRFRTPTHHHFRHAGRSAVDKVETTSWDSRCETRIYRL